MFACDRTSNYRNTRMMQRWMDFKESGANRFSEFFRSRVRVERHVTCHNCQRAIISDDGFDSRPRSFRPRQQRCIMYRVFRQIRLIEILHLMALSRWMGLTRSHRRVDQYYGTTRCLCGCNYFHLRRRSLVQSFLRKDVPPLKLLERRTAFLGETFARHLASCLSPSSLPPYRLLLPRHAFAERA